MGGIEQGIPLEEQFEVPVSDLGFEFMMNALRLMDGFPPALFANRTGLNFSVINEAVTEAVKRGLLMVSPAHVQPTELGKRFLNDLQQIFLPD